MLVKKDPWNLVADFYTPDEEFIYFDDFIDLEAKINDLINNFDNYKNIIEKAYNRSQDYTVEKIYPYLKTKNPELISWKNQHV